MGLAYATAERGADHERAFPIAYEVRGAKTPDGRILDRYGTEGKAYVTKYDQDVNAFYYSVALWRHGHWCSGPSALCRPCQCGNRLGRLESNEIFHNR